MIYKTPVNIFFHPFMSHKKNKLIKKGEIQLTSVQHGVYSGDIEKIWQSLQYGFYHLSLFSS